MKIRIGINGFGRIGRMLAKIAIKSSDIELVMVNDMASKEAMAHLLKYDSIYGVYPDKIFTLNNSIHVGNIKFNTTHFSQPKDIPWENNQVDLVVECTGKFLSQELASEHIRGSVKQVVLSAPSASDNVPTVVFGINDGLVDLSTAIISNASCTTNALAPLLYGLLKVTEITNAYITTIHSYTNDQSLHDSPHKDFRRSRAGAQSIIPTTTGAAKAITKIFPDLAGKMGGCGIRVPVPNGSLIDLTVTVPNSLSIDEINKQFKTLSTGKLLGILEYTQDPIVSVDVIGSRASCLFDAQLTSVIGNMVKVVGWYDNESGYSNRIVDLIKKIALENFSK